MYTNNFQIRMYQTYIHSYIHSYIHTFIQLKDIKEFASILGDDAEGVRDITQLLALADGYGCMHTYIHTYISPLHHCGFR